MAAFTDRYQSAPTSRLNLRMRQALIAGVILNTLWHSRFPKENESNIIDSTKNPMGKKPVNTAPSFSVAFNAQKQCTSDAIALNVWVTANAVNTHNEKEARYFEIARARLENELRQGLLPLTHNIGGDRIGNVKPLPVDPQALWPQRGER
jgi:hypothetical protein